nr:ATP-binding cassette domain-containing protein [Tessaracoccus coleopterorum]
MLPFLTAAENVSMPMLISRAPDRAARSLTLLDLLGVADLADRRPGQLSGGQQQRVAIATALANAPSVLLADEPTGELDEVHSAEVLDVMRSAAEELGTTVLIVTHDPMVSDHVARTIQIRDGRTSTEVLRRTVTDADGTREVAEEYTVIDRNGRIQLPAGTCGRWGCRNGSASSWSPTTSASGRGRAVTAEPTRHRGRGSVMTTPPRLTGRDLHRSFGSGEARVHALLGVDIEVPAGS